MYLKRLIIICFLIIGLSFLVGFIFDTRYQERWQYHIFDKVELSLHSNENFDIIFFGNSRIHSGINPYYVDSITGLNSYNMAVGAADEQEIKLLSTLYLQNHPAPRFVVLGFDAAMLVKYNILRERFPYLFYLKNDSVYHAMKKNGFPVAAIKYFPFLKYSFMDEYNRTSVFAGTSRIPSFRHNVYKGFVNIHPQLNPESTDQVNPQLERRDTLPATIKINDTSASYIEQTFRMFKSKGSTVMLLLPPVREKRGINEMAVNYFTTMAGKYDLPLLRSDIDPEFTPQYFTDIGHLNEPGAKLLSQKIADFILKYESAKK